MSDRLVRGDNTGITIGNEEESYELVFVATNGKEVAKRVTKLTLYKPEPNNPPVIHGMECCIELCD